MNSRLLKIERRMKRCRASKTGERLLFLDFDGVVNVPYRTGTPEYEEAMKRGEYDFFRPEIVARLNRLIKEYGLSVVISSSWRSMGLDFCVSSMRDAGFDPSIHVRGTMPLWDNYPPRSEEILMYLEKEADVSGFLILDDIDMRILRPYAVQTVFEEGYTEACDQKARAILERQFADNGKVFQSHALIAVLAVIVIFLIIAVALYY